MRFDYLRNRVTGAAVLVSACLAGVAGSADETHARDLLKAMSEHLSGQSTLSFDYDATLEVVTDDNEKLGLARSGSISMIRPNTLHASRTGGFSDLEVFFDGKTVTLLGRHAGVYTTLPVEGDIDHVVDALRDDFGRPLPAADLLTSDPFDALMSEVSEVKDLGSGFVAGRECDHLAFRSSTVDWQIWIAVDGDPFPCRFVITARDVPQAPQYVSEFRNWRDDASQGVEFVLPDYAVSLTLDEYAEQVSEFPEHFAIGEE